MFTVVLLLNCVFVIFSLFVKLLYYCTSIFILSLIHAYSPLYIKPIRFSPHMYLPTPMCTVQVGFMKSTTYFRLVLSNRQKQQNTQSHSHTHTHYSNVPLTTYTHTYTYKHTHTFIHTDKNNVSYTLTYTQQHTTHAYTLSLSQKPTHTLSLSHTHTHTHTHICTRNNTP
jgi:hypothetical protein